MRFDEELDVDIVINWYSSIKELILVKTSEGYKKQTVKNYKSGISNFSEYCISNGADLPSKVNRSMLRMYLTELKKSRSSAYCNSRLSQIRVYYDFLIQEDYLTEYQDPTRRIKFMPKQQKMLVVFNDNEIEQMMELLILEKKKLGSCLDK